MILFPILAREARRAAQQRALYRCRLGSVIVAVLIAEFLLGQARVWTSSAAAGREIFGWLIWIGFAFCLFAGVLFASGLLCQERKEGSLALLFLTRLSGLDVILGKLTAILLLTCQVALGLFPILALCIPLGGVSIGEFWRAAEALLATLVLSLSTGLFISALNRELSRSVLITFAVILLPTTLIGFFDSILRQSFPGTTVGGVLPGLIPLMTTILDEQRSATPGSFGLILASQFLLAGVLLMLGGRMLKRLSIASAPAPGRLGRFIHARSAMSVEERGELLQRNPIYWLSQRHRWRWLGAWTLFCLLIVLWFFGFEYFQFVPGARLLTIFAMAPLLHLLLKAAMASECASRLAGARGGELELLLSTPLTSGQIIRGQRRGLMRQFLWPIITMLAVDLVFALAYGRITAQRDVTSIVGYLFIYGLGISMIIDAPALAWVGLWQGLRCETTIQALQNTMARVIVLPLVIFAITAPIVALPLVGGRELFTFLGLAGKSDAADWTIGFILYWWLVSFVTNVFLERDARFHLKNFLRFIAADPRAARAVLDAGPHRRGRPAPRFERNYHRVMQST